MNNADSIMKMKEDLPSNQREPESMFHENSREIGNIDEEED